MLAYAAITPVRDEEENLKRLSASLADQSVRPKRWVVVDTGSRDGTLSYVRDFAAEHPWVGIVSIPVEAMARGGPIVRAFHRGLRELEVWPDVVVKIDGDIAFEGDYFERLLAEFENDPHLGIASGTGYERDADGQWRPRLIAPGQVWGACRAYRRECLRDVLPLEEAMGWDGVDQVKAVAAGWTTGVFGDLPFTHHRREGARDGRRTAAWVARGRASHYMGYRPSYLLLRTLHHARRDPAALSMLYGYFVAWTRRASQADERQRLRLREQQRWRNVVPRLQALWRSGTG